MYAENGCKIVWDGRSKYTWFAQLALDTNEEPWEGFGDEIIENYTLY